VAETNDRQKFRRPAHYRSCGGAGHNSRSCPDSRFASVSGDDDRDYGLQRCAGGCGALLFPHQVSGHQCLVQTIVEVAGIRRGE
jgi:hypothetical protein